MPTNLYGPNDNYHSENSHVMAALIKKFQEAVDNCSESVICWGSGKPLREFIHSRDLAMAIFTCLKVKKALLNKKFDFKLPILNVGTKEEISNI